MSEIDEEQGWDAVEDARPVRRYFDQEGMPGHVIGHEYGQGGPAFPAPDADDVRATVAAIASLAAWRRCA